MAFPTDLEIEVAFNNDIDETDHAQTGWTSILPFVASFSGDLRGRDYELDRTEAGTLQIVLDNSDGRFLPGSVQSPYYPYVKSDRRFRIRGKNMVHPNVARGGSRDRNTTGFLNPVPGITTSAHTNYVRAFDTPFAITVSAEPNAPLQGKEKLQDGIKTTMWTINTQAGSVTYQYPVSLRMQTYSLTIPAGNPNNNPKNWTVQGSNNGSSWTTIHTVTNNTWIEDYETQTFTISSPGFYSYYKLDITANIGATSNTQLAEFDLFYADAATDLPTGSDDLTHYMTVQIPAGKGGFQYHELTGWYVPLEYGVRLTHSAMVWRISGTEPTGWKYKIHITYLDKDLKFLTSSFGVPDASAEVTSLPSTTTPTQLSFSHTPPSSAKYGIVNFAIWCDFTTNATDIYYGITGIQSELPTNIAPDISGYRDTFNWQIESGGTPGTISPVSTAAGTGLIVEATSPAYVSANATTVTTASFTPANNSLLVAMCAAGNGAHATASLGTVTDSLGGTWTRKIYDYGTTDGITEIWMRDVVTGAAMTVTYDPGGTVASGLSLKVQVLTGASAVASQTGTAFCSGGLADFERYFLTTNPNSRVYGAIARAAATADLTANSNTLLYGQIAGSSTDVSATFHSNGEIDLPQQTLLGFVNKDTSGQRLSMVEVFASGQSFADPTSASVAFSWTVDDTNAYITVPRLIPGELYFATVEAKKTAGQPNLLFTGTEGETGELVASTTWSQYTTWFIAQQPEQELRFILQSTPSAGPGLEVRKLRVEKMTIDPPVNSLTNPGFETNTTGWSVTGGTFVRSTSQFNSGVAAGFLTPDGSNTDPRAETTSAQYLACVPGDWITISAWVRPTTTNKQIRIGANWYNSGNSFLSSSTTNHVVNTAATWQYVTVTVQAPASTASSGLRIGLTGTPAAGDTMYIDDVSIWKTPLSLPTSGIESGATTWARPKDIFEGWIERWPSVAGQPEMTITAVDRMKRLGDIDLANTLKESLLQDNPSLLMPLTDSMIDTPGRFSQIGNWGDEEGGPTYVDITASRGDIGASTYTTSTDDGPTGEASFKNNPADITRDTGKGYFFAIPYSKDYAAPTTPPPTKPPAPKPPPPSTGGKTTYTKKWYATWSRSYEGDDSTRFDDSAYMYQGQFSGSPGNQKSLAGFDYKNIQATLAGAEILEAHITVKNAHARWNKGLYAFVGTHNYTSKPGTWNGSNVRERRWRVWVTEGGTVTVNAGTTFGNELKSGSSRGIGIGPESDSDNYGYFYGATQSARPYITVKYRK